MVETLEGCVLESWARARTSSGLPYYVNHNRGVTQWDHPEYVRLMEEVQAANTVKYAAYRTACKLRRLQTRLKLQEVSLQCVASAFDNADLRAGENNDFVEVQKVEHVVQQILCTTYKHRHVQTMLATHLTLNLLLNIFDQSRRGVVQVLGCKVLLIVLCAGRLQEKYRYLFTQVADHNNCCTRRRLAALLRDLARIPELLSEQPSFGVPLVSAAVESCFKEVEGEVGVTEEVLLAWLLQEPQTLVWWTTLYRLTAAELVCHDVKCGVCKQRPIIGLRYQCLHCLGYNLCQDCFLHARTSRRHKLSHPIQEYCHETSSKEWRRSLMKLLRNRLRGRSGDNRQRYLAITSNPEAGSNLSFLGEAEAESCSESSEDDTEDGDLLSRTILHPDDASDSGASSDACTSEGNGGQKNPSEPTIVPTSPRHQIHSIIMHLQDGHKQLEECGDGSSVVPTVEKHTQDLQTQINRLKSILQNFTQDPGVKNEAVKKCQPPRGATGGLHRLESTPIVGERGLLLNLSPIATQCVADDAAVLDNKENHLVENPVMTPMRGKGTPRPSRIPFSASEKNTPSVPSRCEPLGMENSKGLPRPTRLPSFTEVNFSDLTSLTSAPTSGSTSPRVLTPKDEQPDKEKEECSSGVREELEIILRQLDQIFPLSDAQSPNIGVQDSCGVVEAACELGDVLAEYVNSVPNHPTPS